MIDKVQPILYGYFRSTAAYRVRIAANLKGISVRHRHVHLKKGEQNSEQFRKVNRAGLVPYWIDADIEIAQSLAIIEHMDEAVPQPPFLPADVEARAICREIAFAICCDIHPIGNLRVLTRLAELGVAEEARAEWSRYWIKQGFEAIEARLESRSGPFAFGERPTLADICIIPQVFNARRFGLDLKPYRRIREIDEVAARSDAFAAASPDRQADAE
jgi:maleylpyruvate isomerase